jgi:flagellar assembly protein FliH
MNQVRKYGFDTEFAPDGAIVREAPKRLSAEEVEAECTAAYERGKQDAIAQAERKAAAALEALADAASAVLTRLDSESKAMREEAARVAIAAARKIAGAALDAYGQERAIAAVDAAMDALRHQPRLVVKLPTADVAFLQPRIDTMTETHAYAGAVLVRGDDKLRAGEVVIDWSDGCVRMSPDETSERINTLVDAALAAPTPAS